MKSKCSCDFRAQNRLGLQGNPIQIPLVMDTAASIQYRTGPYKLHPLLITKTLQNHFMGPFKGFKMVPCTKSRLFWN